MSSKEDQVKKKLVIEQLRKEEALAKQIEQDRLEEEKRKAAAAALLAEDTTEAQPIDEYAQFNIQASGADNEDWKKIIADFKKQYPENSVQNNVLTFSTKKEALDFFTAQAVSQPPRKFLASELDHNGKPTGFNILSCGDGKIYSGSFDEIQEQLKAAQKENPDDANLKQGLATIARFINPAKGYKETLLQTKEKPESQDSIADHQSESSSPNPLRTTPK